MMIRGWPILVIVTLSLLFTFASLVSATQEQLPLAKASKNPEPADSLNLNFQLKHIFHAPTNKTNPVKRLDIDDSYKARHAESFMAQQMEYFAKVHLDSEMTLEQANSEFDWPQAYAAENPMTINIPMKRQKEKSPTQVLQRRHQPGFVSSYLEYARKHPVRARNIDLEWEEEDVVVPDISDRDTLIGMALIASNAYVRFPIEEGSDWREVPGWTPDEDHDDINFGWEDIGIRGHVFVLEDNSTVVIGIKGTLGAGLPGGGLDETAVNDKTNDNLLFSCCCARVLYMWTTVCDCYDSTYTCNQDCLEKELQREDRYYRAVMEVYSNITKLYPPENHTYWLLGHLLGGALALLLGRTFGIPVVAYEAPGELLPAQRLHLPSAPGLPHPMENIWHVGNTADPIYMGVCNGALSLCNLAGYAMETLCHTGKQCVYDVVNDLGWRLNLLNHRIHTVIDEILTVYNETAPCYQQPPCRDCFNWKFISKDDDEPDEPSLPNPLRPKKPTPKPRPTSTKEQPTSTKSSSPTSTTTTTETPPPKKCLERTWYGWCSKWSDGDDDNGSDEE